MTTSLRRWTWRLSYATVAGALLAGTAPAAQPPRDRVEGTAAEPAVIRGQVAAADTGAPVRLAQVSVFPHPGAGDSTATTDANGDYELVVPPGRYTVLATKAGYMSLAYGQRRAFEPGTLVEARAGEARDDVSFTLPRGAVITGAIYNPFGEPAAGIAGSTAPTASRPARTTSRPRHRRGGSAGSGRLRARASAPRPTIPARPTSRPPGASTSTSARKSPGLTSG